MKEKFLIMFSPATASLNLRSEIFSSCRHRKGKLLDKCSFSFRYRRFASVLNCDHS